MVLVLDVVPVTLAIVAFAFVNTAEPGVTLPIATACSPPVVCVVNTAVPGVTSPIAATCKLLPKAVVNVVAPVTAKVPVIVSDTLVTLPTLTLANPLLLILWTLPPVLVVARASNA